MSRKLTKKQIDGIVNIIIGWNYSKITWGMVCDESASILCRRPSRQSLAYHKEILSAFNCKKKGLADNSMGFKKPSSLCNAAKRIFYLESKVEQLVIEKNNLIEMFIVWQYNLHKLNIQQCELEEHLPPIDRDRFDNKIIK